MDTFEAPLIRFAAGITNDADFARDIVQETFLRWIKTITCSEKAGDRPKEKNLKAWLFKVCRNLAIDALRKDRRMNHISNYSARVAANTASPSSEAESREQCNRVIDVLKKLPEKHREVLRLRYQDDFTYNRISEITGHGISHVGVLIHQGIEKLRDNFIKLGLQKASEHDLDAR